MLRILGLETSCDETAAAIVTDAPVPGSRVLAETVLSQLDEHRPYGGVVPEIASRAHVDHLDRIIAKTLADAGLTLADVDAIAATAGPGLIGGLLVGLMTAKALALAAKKPLIAVNHLEGHALTVRLTNDVHFPYLLLLVSGGHCQFLAVEGVGKFSRLGTTIDDAAGEAFDKTAKLLGLGYPGGPAVEKAAAKGNPKAFDLPRPMQGRPGCDFSFSGLKTAVRNARAAMGHDASIEAINDLAASFQAAVVDIVADRARNAMNTFMARHPQPGITPFVVAGGVAANGALRARLEREAQRRSFMLVAPPLKYCTDNGAMIAWAGLERFRLGLIDDLGTSARARWPLDANAEPKPFAGMKA